MHEAEIKAGMLVVHPRKPEWGPGRVVKIDRDCAWVFWRDADGGEAKRMDRRLVSLQPATTQSDPTLDNLPPLTDARGQLVGIPKRLSLQQAIGRFTARFPGGFYDAGYVAGERGYKEAAHRECVQRFGSGRFARLLRSDCALLVEEVMRTYRSINLLAVFEKAALTDALAEAQAARPFLAALGRVLEDASVSEANFGPYLGAVCDLPSPRGRVATWPVATLIPFLMQPDRHMFLKPSVTEKAAEVLGFNLNYRATPNWPTYSRLLEMGRVYMDRLGELKPRDLIDVQSFSWVVCGGYDKYR